MHCGNCNADVAPVAEFGGGDNPGAPTMGVVEKCPRCQMRLASAPAKPVAERPGLASTAPAAASPVPLTTTAQLLAGAAERLAYVEAELSRHAGLKAEARTLRRLIKATTPRN